MPFIEAIDHDYHPETNQGCIQCTSRQWITAHLLWFPVEESMVQESMGWRSFPVSRLDVAVLFWGLVNITSTKVIKLCQLTSRLPVSQALFVLQAHTKPVPFYESLWKIDVYIWNRNSWLILALYNWWLLLVFFFSFSNWSFSLWAFLLHYVSFTLSAKL